MVEAYFDNIKQVISDELRSAKHSIYVAVAWFTDKDLFDILKQKCLSGIEVKLLILGDEINNNSGIDYTSLNRNNSRAYIIALNDTSNLMHHKFCVIDGKTVLTGSYNWSYRARQNDENITVTRDHSELALQFIEQFKNIVVKYFGKSSEQGDSILDYSKFIKRLVKIKLLIELEEIDEIERELPKVTNHTKDVEGLTKMLNAITSKNYSTGLLLLQNIINKYQALTVYDDPELFGLNLELKALELELTALADEKSEIEKIIREFSIKHNRALGAIISAILLLRLKNSEKNKSKSDEAKRIYEQAKVDYENYHKQHEEIKLEKLYDLSEVEKKELKFSFRKAALLCHPDKVSEELKEKAEELFKQLKEAYDQNDLVGVKQLLHNIESNKLFADQQITISEKEKLKGKLSLQKSNIERLNVELEELKNTEVYKTLTNINDWDIYFQETLVRLKVELEILKKEK